MRRRPGADRTEIVMAAKRQGWAASGPGRRLMLTKGRVEVHAMFDKDGRLYRAGIKDGPSFTGESMLMRLIIFLDTGQ